MSDVVTVNAPVSYRRWIAPNFANVDMPPRPRQEGMQALPSVAIKDLAPEALDALAAAWLSDLYTKADRPCPFANLGASHEAR
jgi:hypothetical protein